MSTEHEGVGGGASHERKINIQIDRVHYQVEAMCQRSHVPNILVRQRYGSIPILETGQAQHPAITMPWWIDSWPRPSGCERAATTTAL